MVRGLDHFKKHFAAYTDRYVLIGGTAASMAMEELGGNFRATRDLDIVLCVEALDREFVETFWSFIRQGRYENRQQSTGKRLLYRFFDPGHDDFPEMLELFSKVPDILEIKGRAGLTPIPVDDDTSSLSAILMNEDYYDFVMNNRVAIDGLSVIKADALIPLKARAYVDLSNRRATGDSVDSNKIRKHKNDVFRLFTVLDRGSRLPLTGDMQADLTEALTRIATEPADLKSLGIVRMTLIDVIEELRRFYQLSE